MEEEVLEKVLAAAEFPYEAGQILELWEFWRTHRPDYQGFIKRSLPFVMAISGNLPIFQTTGLITILWDKFQEVDEALKMPSRFSYLSLSDTGRTSEHHLLSQSKYSFCSRSSGSLPTQGLADPPLVYQHKGVEALRSVMCDWHYPESPDKATVEELFPEDDWSKVLSMTDTKSEPKLTILFDKHRKKAFELANCVFIKPKKDLCSPKVPDFILVDKDCWEWPTAETVGALLFAQSTTESKNSYTSDFAVGEAVAVAQILLKNVSQRRQFMFIGLTNCKKVRWFRVCRPSINGSFNGSRGCETIKVRESLAGMMCCHKESLGICLQPSFVVGQEHYRVGRWLGEGATASVYAVYVEGEGECAAKLAKPGHSISTDLRNLQLLQNIKGIPRIVMSEKPSVLVVKPVAEQFNTEQLCKNQMYNHVGDLVGILQCAHNRGIVNRDIRTANILIAKDQFLIVDWGYATDANRPDKYAGTIHFASSRVLKNLEEGQYTFKFEPSDDLVSLVRTLYAFVRLNGMRLQSLLTDLSNDDYAEVQKFWETELSKSPWQNAELCAKQCDYAALKDWIQNRFERM